MPFPDINPIAFWLGPLPIRWYSLAYLAGIVLGGAYCRYLISDRRLWLNKTRPIKADQIWDFACWAMVSVVVGGRAGYVLFYNFPHYISQPLQILNTLDGGMSFHGGLTGLAVTGWFYARRHGARPLSLLDLLAAAAPIGLFFGRIANFVNAELYGAPTNLPWGVVFPGEDVARHPSQLYEAALEGMVLFLFLALLIRFGHGFARPGLIAGAFGIGYAVSRFIVEFFRLPDPQIGYLAEGWLTMGQLLSLPIGVVACVLVSLALAVPRRSSC